jgi:hypothetical protein
MTQETSLRTWLISQIKAALPVKVKPPPFMVWYDPDREWIDLLRLAAEPAGVELWAPAPGEPDPHELALRDRFAHEPRRRRIVWLPRARANVTFFKVFELAADRVWNRSLAEALTDYGVPVARRHEAELRPILALQARTWFEHPSSVWQELTPRTAKDALFDDSRILDVLTSKEDLFQALRAETVFPVFASRVMDDLGLPDPNKGTESEWRIEAMRRLLLMEAAASGGTPPLGAQTLPVGLIRERALKLLQTCQHDLRHSAGFERVVLEADRHLGLDTWARSQSTPPRTTASRAIEEALLSQQIERYERIDSDVVLLARELASGFTEIAERARNFWGRRADRRVQWGQLHELAEAACVLTHYHSTPHTWATARDMIDAYAHDIWRIERAGETLFRETRGISDPMHKIRARLRRAYQRIIDDLGKEFSQRLDAAGPALELDVSSAGERVLKELAEKKQPPTALVILDAFRFELARRLAEHLQQHDPPERLEVAPALAPIPSITAIGMAFALPIPRSKLHVAWATGKHPNWSVTTDGWSGDLTVADNRRRWLTEKGGAKACLTTNEVLEGARLRDLGEPAKLIFVYGDEIDRDGHEGSLEITGADDHLERYASVVRTLRAAGYARIIVTTDHGFFHWQPEPDERDDMPRGDDILYSSRRAVVGRSLTHATALRLRVPCSDLEVFVPRSVNAFRTYGALGFFHGGATLQELVIPVLLAVWSGKRKKTPVSLRKLEFITSLQPRLELVSGVQSGLFVDGSLLPRSVLVRVVAQDILVFHHHEPVTVDPHSGKPATVTLKLVDPSPDVAVGTPLRIEVRDADNGDFLVAMDTVLKVEINSAWD